MDGQAQFLLAVREFRQALMEATKAGVLDELQSGMADPDTINLVCDGVDEMRACLETP